MGRYVAGDFWSELEQSILGQDKMDEAKALGLEALIKETQAAVRDTADKFQPTKEVVINSN